MFVCVQHEVTANSIRCSAGMCCWIDAVRVLAVNGCILSYY